jgi:hypothetical protein
MSNALIENMFYLQEDYSMFAENMQSYIDPDEPDKLKNHLSNLTQEFAGAQGNLNDSMFIFMTDQLAMALFQVVNINMNQMILIDLETCPDFEAIRPCMEYLPIYSQGITDLIENHTEVLTKALLCIYLYKHSKENETNVEAIPA